MPSCSVHHCVLFLLTLTFTTDPGSAVSVFPIYTKLHQSVTLPCEAQCSGRGWWSLDSQRDVVFAQCNQTSCRSEKQGYEMSHDQYKRGDLSLTITNPDYSMRETYTCECDLSDYVTVRLRISTVFSAVQVQTEGDLKLDLSVPEPVEVIYRGSVLSDDVQICTVTDRTLECNTEYTPRTSLSNSELTLRNMKRSESGTYTIRNLDYKEDIRVYDVSVSGLTRGETAGIVIPVLLVLLVLLFGGLLYYMWRKAEQKRKQVMRDKEAVNDLMAQALLKPPVEMMAALQQVEEKINDLEWKYRWDREYKELITLFCNSKREETELYRNMVGPQVGDVQTVTGEVKSDMLKVYEDINETLHSAVVEEAELQWVEKKIKDLERKYCTGGSVHSEAVMLFCNAKRLYLRGCRDVFITGNTSLQPVTQEVKTVMKAVDDLIKKAEDKPGGEQEEEMQEVFQKITDLEVKYSQTEAYYRKVTRFCKIKREELNCCTEFYETQNKTTEHQRKEKVEKEMDAVDVLIQKVLHPPPGEQEKVLKNAEDKINDVQQKYPGLVMYCVNKRRELDVCRRIYETQKGSLQPGTGEVMNEIKAAYEVIRQYKHRPTLEVEKKINDLEQKCRENSEYYSSVGMFWNKKRRDLERCSKLGLLELEFIRPNTEKEMEKVVKMLNELKLRFDQNRTVSCDLLFLMFMHVGLSLDQIKEWCREQRDSLNEFKQQLSDELRDNKMICDVERHLIGLEQWCWGKDCELEIYSKELKHRGEISNANPQTSRSRGGENTALLQVETEQK